MALSRLAREFAAEIKQQDWTDAPYRTDRAGHDRAADKNRGSEVLTDIQAARVRMNVMWVAAQVVGYSDPNFDEYEFAEACGVNTLTSTGRKNGAISAGLRRWHGRYMCPGTWEFDPLTEAITTETSDFYHASTECDLFQLGWRHAPILTFEPDAVPEKWKACVCITQGQD